MTDRDEQEAGGGFRANSATARNFGAHRDTDDRNRPSSPFLTEALFANESMDFGGHLESLFSETPFSKAFASPISAGPELSARDLRAGSWLQESYAHESREQEYLDSETFDELAEAYSQQFDEAFAPEAELIQEEGPCCEGEAPVRDEYAPDYEDELFQEEAWTGNSAQIEFRQRVLDAHLETKRKRSGPPQRDLRPDELAQILGTRISVRKDAAKAAGALLATANADLAKAQVAGHSDALRTVRLTVTSGYRPYARQLDLWRSYFRKYYAWSAAEREKLPGGAHGAAAIAYMLKPKGEGGFGLGGRIGAPGYSNHQNGIAVDFFQERTSPKHRVSNSSAKAARARWRVTWFYGWLKDNAHRFGFVQLPSEEWHWDFKLNAAQARGGPDRAPAPAKIGANLGGRLWAFRAPTGNTRVTLYSPPAAQGRKDVSLLLFFHGLLGSCQPGAKSGAGLVDKSPFNLGRLIDQSGRPVVVAVPDLNWSKSVRWHDLGHPGRINALCRDILNELNRAQGLAPIELTSLIIAGHSRAYGVLEPLARASGDPEASRGAMSKLSQVWAFDTTYLGNVESWLTWLKRNPTLRMSVFYRPKTQTAAVGSKFYRHRSNRFQVVAASERHCLVPSVRLPALLRGADLVSREASSEVFDSEEEEVDFEHWENDAEDEIDRLDSGSQYESEAAEEYEDSQHEPGLSEVDYENLDDEEEFEQHPVDLEAEEQSEGFEEFGEGIERLEETEIDEAELFDEEADEELDPRLIRIAESVMAGETPEFQLQASRKWTRCFSADDIARLDAAYRDNQAAALQNSEDRCSCIVMLNVGLGQLLSLLLKRNRARGKSDRRVDMGDLPTKSISAAMNKLRKRGYALRQQRIDFLDSRGKRAGTLAPERLAESVRARVLSLAGPDKCWYAFGLSIMADYHSVLLLVDARGPSPKIYWLDQFAVGVPDPSADVTSTLDQKITDKTKSFWETFKQDSIARVRAGKAKRAVTSDTPVKLWQLQKKN